MRHIKFFHQFSFYLLPRWLRRKLKRWHSGFARFPRAVTKIALATVMVVGVFLEGGGCQTAFATDYLVNYEEVDGRTWDGSSNYNWDNVWTPANGHHTFQGSGNNGVIYWINEAGKNSGNRVVLTNSTYGSPNISSSPSADSYSVRYRANWGSTVNSDTAAINITNDVTLIDNRNGSYTITNITKTGGGILTIQNGAWANDGSFDGQAGGIKLVNTNLISSGAGTTRVGGVNGFTFDTNGNTWTVQNGLTAWLTFTKAGAGAMNVTGYSDITGSSYLTGGTWSSSTGLRVGEGSAGTLTTSANTTLTANALTVGDGGNGTLTNNGTMTSTTSDIGNTSQGTVNNYGDWTSSGLTRVGAGAVGTVNQHSGKWDAAGQNVLVGATSNGTVNQSGGTWINQNTYIGNDPGKIGIVNISGNSHLEVIHDLKTGYGPGTAAENVQGNLYVWGGAHIEVGNDHIIADGRYALGRDYIDGYGTTMTVGGNLIVGNNGQAGGTYTEDRSKDRYQSDPSDGDWLFDPNAREPLGTIGNAKGGLLTGNDPGLAITRGATVRSGTGQIGVDNNSGGPDDWASGYVVIDNRGNTSKLGSSYYNPMGTNYSWEKNDRPFYALAGTVGDTTPSDHVSQWIVNKKLEVGVNGNAFLRVINGGTLVTGIDKATGDSTIIASGSGRGELFVNGNSDAWGRSIFKSYGATVVGEGSGRGTLRIYDGALGETAGLYIGTDGGSKGEVFVDGIHGSGITALRIMADHGSSHYIGTDTDSSGNHFNPAGALTATNRMKGDGIFGASHQALVWMDADALVQLNGIAGFATGSVLHLDNTYKIPSSALPPGSPTYPFGQIDATHNPLFDAGTGRVNFTNARVEGIGTVTAQNGVHIHQSAYDPGQASIDPGLIYGWETNCEKDFFGNLYFGHSLNMTGNVITYFDIDAGFYNFDTQKNEHRSQDNIFVVADPLVNDKPVTASLSGTLLIHPRLTDYYNDEIEKYDIVTTGINGSYSGIIDENYMYDRVSIKAERFFTDIHQEIDTRLSDPGNLSSPTYDVLTISMKVNKTPFEDSATTWNERSLGRVLDSIYALQDRVWLPFLRNFWYLEDPEFLEAYKLYGGEIRAHSLLMPLQNPWTYAHNRNGFSRCTGHAFFGPQNRSCNVTSGSGLWGSYILTGNSTESDGNAGKYDLKRNGFAIGYEKAAKGGDSYAGVMFAYNQGKLDTWRADAKSDDFQLGLYHGKRLWDQWEWKNYLGMGVQNYTMRRHVEMKLSHSTWNETDTVFVCSDQPAAGAMLSNFTGLNFAGSTELGRPFYFGKCRQWTLRPYMGFDMAAVWQNSASEYGELIDRETGKDAIYEVNGEYYRAADLVALDYSSTRNIRVYGRPGFMLERGGSNGNLRAGVSYSCLMGGHRYTNVTNQFQFGGDKFNLRGVDDGSGFVTGNVGLSAFVGKRKFSMVCLDYAVIAGSHSTIHAGQLGFQRLF